MGKKNQKVEISDQNGLIEIRYFETSEDDRYLSWKLPLSIIDSVIKWQQMIKKQKEISLPVKERTKRCEIIMNSDQCVEIKALDLKGRTSMIGWSLPFIALDKVGKWRSISKV